MNNNQGRKRVRRARKNTANVKRILLTICMMALVAVVSIGGTIAWLTDDTEPVTNTFTTTDVEVTLTETERDYEMVPGNKLDKNPTVTLTADSEDSWIFVEVSKSADFDKYLHYEMADGWTELATVSGVYYYNGTAAKGTPIPVLKDNAVTVDTEITKAQMAELKGNEPTMTFTAYACQKANVADAATAWAYIQNGGLTQSTGN